MRTLRLLDRSIEKITVAFCSFLLVSLVGVVFIAVIFRYVLNDPLMWSDEVARFLCVWLILIGASLTARDDEHTSIDLIFLVIKNEVFVRVMTVITRLVCILSMVAFFPISIWLMEMMGDTISAAIRMPMRYLYLAFTVGSVLMIIGFAHAIPKLAKKNYKEENE